MFSRPVNNEGQAGPSGLKRTSPWLAKAEACKKMCDQYRAAQAIDPGICVEAVEKIAFLKNVSDYNLLLLV